MSDRYYVSEVGGWSITSRYSSASSHGVGTSVSVSDSVDCHREVYTAYQQPRCSPLRFRRRQCERVCAELNTLERAAA